MDLVEQYVNNDPSVKGIWCVPKYSNPQGITYSDETVRRFARLKPAAEDFRIYWDNAYGIHHLYEDKQDNLIEILHGLQAGRKPGYGLQVLFHIQGKLPWFRCGSHRRFQETISMFIKQQMTIQTIGHDKLNQLRHVRFFKDIHGMVASYEKARRYLKTEVRDRFRWSEERAGRPGDRFLDWSPSGGYFISFDALAGLCESHRGESKRGRPCDDSPQEQPIPYGKDPQDSNIRIAPSYPTPEELAVAVELFVLCVKLVSIDKILEEK